MQLKTVVYSTLLLTIANAATIQPPLEARLSPIKTFVCPSSGSTKRSSAILGRSSDDDAPSALELPVGYCCINKAIAPLTYTCEKASLELGHYICPKIDDSFMGCCTNARLANGDRDCQNMGAL